MRLAIWITALTLFVPALALAAGTQGTCSGNSGLVGDVGLAIADASGSIESIALSSLPFVFGAAECACPNQDVMLDIFLYSALPAGTTGTAEVWVGSGCDTNVTARTTAGATLCEKVAILDFSQFVAGSTPSSGHLYVPIPTQPLFAPVTHECPTVNQSNGVYVLLFSGSNASPAGPPFVSCSLDLQETSVAPDAPANLAATPETDAVVLSWSAADTTFTPIAYYQVLCDDGNDEPIARPPSGAVYSVCTADGIERRALPLGSELQPAPTLASLDAAFVCSPPIPPGAGSLSTRITGLTAGKSYRFVVVSIDPSGNATPSAEITAGPLAVQPEPSTGGCSYSGSGAATPTLAFAALALALAALRRRRAPMA